MLDLLQNRLLEALEALASYQARLVVPLLNNRISICFVNEIKMNQVENRKHKSDYNLRK